MFSRWFILLLYFITILLLLFSFPSSVILLICCCCCKTVKPQNKFLLTFSHNSRKSCIYSCNVSSITGHVILSSIIIQECNSVNDASHALNTLTSISTYAWKRVPEACLFKHYVNTELSQILRRTSNSLCAIVSLQKLCYSCMQRRALLMLLQKPFSMESSRWICYSTTDWG